MKLREWLSFVFVSSSSPAGGSPVRVAARRPGSRLAASFLFAKRRDDGVVFVCSGGVYRANDGRNGRLGLPGGKPTWEPAGYATLERVLAAS